MNLIVTCKCGDTKQFAADAYKLLFPSLPVPRIVIGRLPVRDEAEQMPKREREMLLALLRQKRKFAYLFSDAEGIWDLMAGVQIA